MAEQKIAGVKRLSLEAGAVTGDKEPMRDLTAKEFNRTDRGKLARKLGILGVDAFRKNQPNAVIPGGFGTIPEHKNDAVCQVD